MKKSILFFLLLLIPVVYALETSSTNYRTSIAIAPSENMGSTNYNTVIVMGQIAIGNASSEHYITELGILEKEIVILTDIRGGSPSYTVDYICNKSYYFILEHRISNDTLEYTELDLFGLRDEIQNETGVLVYMTILESKINNYNLLCRVELPPFVPKLVEEPPEEIKEPIAMWVWLVIFISSLLILLSLVIRKDNKCLLFFGCEKLINCVKRIFRRR